MSALLNLAARCEAAAGPNWQLEQDIAQAVGYDDFQSQPFTASLDAAMTLAPKGWMVKLGKSLGEPGYAEVYRFDGGERLTSETICAATLPLALCAAALRAQDSA